LGSPGPTREVRKTVTVVFTDVTGSTSLGERLDPESLRRVMSRYFEEMQAVLERHGGTVEKFIGDAVVAVFGIPVLHEDDALRAVRAADEMRDALAALNDDLDRTWGVRIAVRTGVNTGEVVAGDPAAGQSFVIGDAVNVAARLEQAAAPGQVLIGESTYRLVRDAVEAEPVEPLALKGKGEPVPALSLVRVVAGAPGTSRRLDSPLVGRGGEQRLLTQAFERVEGERASHLFTILGAAGVGKTRLAGEFLDAVRGRASVVSGRCLAYGDGITYWPITQVVREAAGLTGDESAEETISRIAAMAGGGEQGADIAEQVAQVMGLSEATAAAEETFRAVRHFLEAAASERPLVLVLDDLHWAEPTLLDLVEHIADWSRDAPILILVMARPDLLDLQPGWGGGKLNATSILLEALTDSDCEELIENLLGQASLAVPARERITAAAEGNPLFVEEMLGMLVDSDLLRQTNGGWEPVRDLSDVAVPPTIQALLAARLDRLAGEERAVMERASVEGKVFHRGAVAALSSNGGGLDSSLMGLVRKELIRPSAAEFPGEEAFRFRHQLIRDAAYESLPKEARAELHERFAAWLEDRAAARVVEQEEFLGYHLEQAYRYREQLGPVDEAGRALARRAAERLAVAGRRALARTDMGAAASLLGRAASLLDPDDPGRPMLMLDLGSALIEHGELQEAQRVLDEARGLAEVAGDRALGARVDLRLLEMRIMTETDVPDRLRIEEIDPLIEVFQGEGDDIGLARGWLMKGTLLFWTGRAGEAEEVMQRSLAIARRVGDRQVEMEGIQLMTALMIWGSIEVDDALRLGDELVSSIEGTIAEAWFLGSRACLLGMLGRFDEGRPLMARANEIALDLGLKLIHAANHPLAEFELYADNPEAVVERFVPAVAELERMGERGFLSTTAGYVAEAMYRLGRFEEAERYLAITQETASEDDIASQVQWRSIRGKMLARRGEAEEGERLATEAVALTAETDQSIFQALACADLAEVLALVGKHAEAKRRYLEAAEHYDRKGAIFLAEKARAMAVIE
jgi:class 3 adenylate cyclase/tetratricopeptide (TPR) repeat protein